MRWFESKTVWARLIVIAVLLGYVAAIVITHSVQLAPVLDVPLVFVGWLCALGLFVWTRFTGEHRPQSVLDWFRPFALTIVFGIIAASAFFLADIWELPSLCHGDPLDCVKGYQWSIEGTRYFHTKADGTQQEINAQIYLEEVGQELRGAATFGVFALCLAFAAAAALGPTPTVPSPPKEPTA